MNAITQEHIQLTERHRPMKKLISLSKPIALPSRQKDSLGARRLNFRAVAFHGALLSLLIFGGIRAVQAQQPDPLTVTKDGKVGIGTSAPANKLSVAGDADFSGTVGIGPGSLGTSKFRIANSASDFAHFRFGDAGAGEFEFVGWGNGWNINSKTSGKNLYLNRDAEATSSVIIGRSGKEMIVKGDTGNVGIGTNPVFGKLQVAGGATPALRLEANSGVAAMSIGGTGQLLVDAVGVTGGRFIVKDNGNVGIGTNNPTRAKLEISGGVNQTVRQYGFLNLGNPTGKFDVPGPDAVTVPYSIWADKRIAAEEFNAFSDERLKDIQGRSDSALDLRTLLSIEITDYRNKDVITKGNGTYKKVTGQQVEKVFPQAVSKHTEVVPDIYQQASIADGWVTLATDLKKGERVKLITENGEGIYEVLEVAEGRFRTGFKPEGNRIFVYGREVNDFLTVDYGAISMLNVSATQQIKKEKDEEVKALQEENAGLRSQLAEQERRLAAIESLLLAGDKQPTRAMSLKKVE